MKITNQWCVIVINHEDVRPSIESVIGPFQTKGEASEVCHDFNDEYDGSPFYSIMMPMAFVDLKVS